MPPLPPTRLSQPACGVAVNWCLCRPYPGGRARGTPAPHVPVSHISGLNVQRTVQQKVGTSGLVLCRQRGRHGFGGARPATQRNATPAAVDSSARTGLSGGHALPGASRLQPELPNLAPLDHPAPCTGQVGSKAGCTAAARMGLLPSAVGIPQQECMPHARTCTVELRMLRAPSSGGGCAAGLAAAAVGHRRKSWLPPRPPPLP